MATPSKRPPSPDSAILSITTTKFVGPAQKEFGSFRELANFSLDTNCPNWRNLANPESYLIPPLFYYKNANLNDQYIEEAKKAGAARDSKDPRFCDVKFRGADDAEHIIYKAIEDMIQEKLQAPFISIHGLNMDRVRYVLKELFPHLRWNGLQAVLSQCFHDQLSKNCPNLEDARRQQLNIEFQHHLNALLCNQNVYQKQFSDFLQKFCQDRILDGLARSKLAESLHRELNSYFREYDFVIIGPKIGLVIVEVKQSPFTQKKDFTKGSKHLPDDYFKGLQQLRSFDSVAHLLKECASTIDNEMLNMRKVLFTPNLRRQRFDEWYKDLDIRSKQAIDQRLRDANECWFAEDMENHCKSSGMPSIYKTLRRLVQSNFQAQSSMRVYQTYGPLIAGLASVATFSSKCFGLSLEKLSDGEALMKESYRIETQDTMGRVTMPKRPKTENMAQPETVNLNKAIILTPAQKAASEGPNRQFIVGAAGTGKTIILQAKALELLKDGKSVLVFCPPWYAQKYKQLFDDNSFTKYTIQSSWKDLIKGLHSLNTINDVQNLALDAYQLAEKILESNTSSSTLKELLANIDGLFIDDMMDRFAWSRLDGEDSKSSSDLLNSTADVHFCLTVMAYAKLLNSATVVWVAFDFWTDHEHYYYLEDFMKTQRVMKKFLDFESDYYTITKLDRVMRCPEKVFQAAYVSSGQCGPVIKPQLGHKIQGKRSKFAVHCNIDDDAGMEPVREKVQEILNMLANQNISFDNVCLILGDGWRNLRNRPSFFEKCEEEGIPARLLQTIFPMEFQYTSAVGECSQDRGILTIYGSEEVSSSEWPIVIFIDCRDSDQPLWCFDYRRFDYRARTRATAELIEIIAVRNSSITKRCRSFSETFATYNDYMKTRSPYKRSETAQFRNMAGPVELLARLASQLRLSFPPRKFIKEYRQQLWANTRRRNYTTCELDLRKKHKLHQIERKNLRERGFVTMAFAGFDSHFGGSPGSSV